MTLGVAALLCACVVTGVGLSALTPGTGMADRAIEPDLSQTKTITARDSNWKVGASLFILLIEKAESAVVPLAVKIFRKQDRESVPDLDRQAACRFGPDGAVQEVLRVVLERHRPAAQKPDCK